LWTRKGFQIRDFISGGKHMNRRAFLKSLAGAGALSAGAAAPPAFGAAKPVNIGVILPLSGPNAQFGINSRNGIEFAADDVNAAGGIKVLGGAKINLVVADAAPTPAAAAAAAQRLVAQNDVTAVIGAFVSSLTLAISDVTEQRGIPLLTMSAADQITGRGFKNIFQLVPRASLIGTAQLAYTLELSETFGGARIDRIAVIYEDTAYGAATSKGIRTAAKNAGIAVVMDDSYPLAITDAKPLIDKLRSSGAEAVYPVSYLNDSMLILRTVREQGITIPAIGGSAGYVIPDFEKALGLFAEGVLSITTANYDLAPELADRFRQRFGYFMVHEAFENAVCLDLVVQAIERAGSAKPEEVAAALHGVRFDNGLARTMTNGAVQFNQAGLNTLAVPVMVQWHGKDLATVWPQEFARAKAVWPTA
jgi:branched-chain amino acid transport system substrate-binding protein